MPRTSGSEGDLGGKPPRSTRPLDRSDPLDGPGSILDAPEDSPLPPIENSAVAFLRLLAATLPVLSTVAFSPEVFESFCPILTRVAIYHAWLRFSLNTSQAARCLDARRLAGTAVSRILSPLPRMGRGPC
jgi:hypothetical protein